jgi:transcriptional regulator with XRE-family HTH domain
MTNRILALREENDLNQKQISQIIGVSRSLISKWECDKESIPLKHLLSYSNYFKKSFDYLTNISNNNTYLFIKALDPIVIGNNLKEVREHHNDSVRSLANKLNTTHSTITAYETGKVLIKTDFAIQICKIYNISLDWLCQKKR